MSNHVHLTFQPAALGQLLLTSSATNLQAHSWLGETLMTDPLRHIPVCNSSNSQDLPVGGAFVNPPGLTIVYAKSLPGAPGSMKRLSCLFLSTKASLSTARVWRARARLRENELARTCSWRAHCLPERRISPSSEGGTQSR